MPLSQRLRIARTTYRDTVAEARRDNTPRAWRRLVRAGQNLRDVEAAARREVRARLPRPRRSVHLVEDDPRGAR